MRAVIACAACDDVRDVTELGCERGLHSSTVSSCYSHFMLEWLRGVDDASRQRMLLPRLLQAPATGQSTAATQTLALSGGTLRAQTMSI